MPTTIIDPERNQKKLNVYEFMEGGIGHLRVRSPVTNTQALYMSRLLYPGPPSGHATREKTSNNRD